MLSLKFISNQNTLVIQNFTISEMIYFISVEDKLSIHYYIFDYNSKFIASISPLEKYTFSNVNFVIFVGKVQVDERSEI